MPIPPIGIVDDDASACEDLSTLIQAAGYRTATFESAEAFLSGGYNQTIDCLILDIPLAGITGLASSVASLK